MIDVYGNMALDLAFSADPEFSDTQMGIYFNSTFFNKKTGYSVPKTSIQALGVDTSTKGNIKARVSKYTADSFLKVLYESGRLTYTINQTIIPSNIPIVLNTDLCDGFVPGILKKYGSGKAVTINLIAREAPMSIFNDKQMGAIAAMDIEFKVGTETAIVLNMKGM